MIEKQNKFIVFFKNLVHRVLKHDLSTMAASLSYYFLSASIPLMLVLTTLVGKYLGGNKELLLELVQLLPGQTQEIVMSMIDSLLNSPNASSLSILTLIFAIWSASKGIFNLLDSLNKAYGKDDIKSSIGKKILSFLYTFVLVLIVIVFMGLRIYGPKIIEMINNFLNKIELNPLTEQVTFISELISGFLPLIIMSLALGLLYKLAANRDEEFNISYKEGLIGGVFTTVVVFVASFAYSFFLDNMSNMSVIYGTLAGFLSLFIWIMIFSYSIILGAEVIAAYIDLKKGKVKKIPKDLEDKLPESIKEEL